MASNIRQTLEGGGAPPDFPLSLRLLGWNCDADCKYRCAHTMQAMRAAEGLKPAKYFGKWSFARVWGRGLHSSTFELN